MEKLIAGDKKNPSPLTGEKITWFGVRATAEALFGSLNLVAPQSVCLYIKLPVALFTWDGYGKEQKKKLSVTNIIQMHELWFKKNEIQMARFKFNLGIMARIHVG